MKLQILSRLLTKNLVIAIKTTKPNPVYAQTICIAPGNILFFCTGF
jgi:hypothetical protein